jgi:hypothetical protein
MRSFLLAAVFAPLIAFGQSAPPHAGLQLAVTNDGEETLRTEYVSQTMLRAWIPRERWRKHQVVYRLVVLTPKGLRYSREIESKDGQ